MIKRRQFIAGLGSAAAWPGMVRAQQPERVRRVGVLIQARESDPVAHASIASFQLEPRRLGWLEGRNVRIVVRKAASAGDQLGIYAANW